MLEEFRVDALGPEAHIDQHIHCDNSYHGNANPVTHILRHLFTRMMESLHESKQEVDAKIVEGLQTILKGGVERLRVQQVSEEQET